MAGDIVFRRAEVDDASAIARLRMATREETYRGIYPDEWIDGFDLAASERMLADTIQEAGEELYLIECDDSPAGFFGYGKPTYDILPPDALCLTFLYLLRAFQHRGIGTRAIEHVRAYCRSTGRDRFYNGCNLHNENAIRFYQAIGGRVIGWCTEGGNKAKDQIVFEYLVPPRAQEA